MSLFSNLKMAQDMLKNMSPEQIEEMMKMAGDQKKQMEEMVRKLLEEEIQKRGLITRDEARKMIHGG